MRSKYLFPVLAFAALLAFGAQAFGVDIASLMQQHADVGFGLSMLALAGRIEDSEVVQALSNIKSQVNEKLDPLVEQNAVMMSRLRAIEQKGDLRGGRMGFESEDVGDVVIKSAQLANLRDGSAKSIRVSIKSFQLGSKANLTSADYPGIAQRDPTIYGPLSRRMSVRDLLITQTTEAPSIEFLRATQTGAAAIQVTEGDVKAQLAAAFVLVSAPVRTIACWLPASRQVIDDNVQLKDFIDQTLRDALQLTEDAQLLIGSGVGSNILGLITAATAYNRTVVGDTPIDALRRAITQVQLARGVASGIVINPIGLERLELIKDLDGNYVVNFRVDQGNGRTVMWRVPVVVTDAIAAGDFLVGDFTRAARLYDRQQATVEIGSQHANFFVENMLAVLCEERVALTIPRPDLLVKGSFV